MDKEFKDAILKHNKKMNRGVVRSDKTGGNLRKNIVFTSVEILSSKEVALTVLRDDVGHWEVYGASGLKPETLALVSFAEILDCDPSLEKISRIEFGESFTRTNSKSPWR